MVLVIPGVNVVEMKERPALACDTLHLKDICIKTVIRKKCHRTNLPRTILKEVSLMEETMKVLGEPMKLLMFLHGKCE